MINVELRLPSPTRYLLVAFLLIAPTAILGALSVLTSNAYKNETAIIIYQVFWVGEETNFPTFVNFILLMIASVLVFIVASRAFINDDQWRWHWLGFASLMLLMAFDEAAQMHEPVGRYLTQGVTGRGFLKWSWVVAGGAVVVFIALLGFRFVRAMEPRTKFFVLLGALVYVGGALGLEALSGFLNYHKMGNARVITLGEETLEMLGASLFGAAALAQLLLPNVIEGRRSELE